MTSVMLLIAAVLAIGLLSHKGYGFYVQTVKAEDEKHAREGGKH